MRLLLLALLATSLAAAGAPTIGWLPLPPSVAWHSDSLAPSGAALIGRALAIVVVNLNGREETNPGLNTYWNLRWWWTEGGRPINCRQGALMFSVNGQLLNREEGKSEFLIKGQDNSNGFLRALAGDASAAMMLINADGRVIRLSRCTDLESIKDPLDALLPKEGSGLIADDALYTVTCRPAVDLLKVGNIKGALALCARKLGADGTAMAKDVTARADALLTADITRLGDANVSASQRFIIRGQVDDLLAAFPASAKAAEATKAIHGLREDKAYAAEEAGWAALQDYLVQVTKAQPKRQADLQKQLLTGITSKFPDTYAAELAGMIRAAARIAP